MTDQVPAGKHIAYQSDDGTTVQVKFVDLFDVPASLSALSFLREEEAEQQPKLMP
jgi:hypothetical protein